MIRQPATLISITAAALLAGCTWVQPEPGTQSVAIRSADEITRCEARGETSASVRHRVAAIERKPGKVADELDTLARNSAMEMGANVIVPLGPVKDGKRSYGVYRCP